MKEKGRGSYGRALCFWGLAGSAGFPPADVWAGKVSGGQRRATPWRSSTGGKRRCRLQRSGRCSRRLPRRHGRPLLWRSQTGCHVGLCRSLEAIEAV